MFEALCETIVNEIYFEGVGAGRCPAVALCPYACGSTAELLWLEGYVDSINTVTMDN